MPRFLRDLLLGAAFLLAAQILTEPKSQAVPGTDQWYAEQFPGVEGLYAFPEKGTR
jgi:hypothetical protein